MKRTIRVQVANPAGNTTIFVHDPVPQEHYSSVGRQLLDMEELEAEQVAFITGDRSMEMCGLEFCGNATRSFALLKALQEEKEEPFTMTVDTSGVAVPVRVDLDPAKKWCRLHMPTPKSIRVLEDGTGIVDMDGIIHMVVRNVPASREVFDQFKDEINAKYDPPAMGVMFLKETEEGYIMTPFVYVRDVDSTYEEGSCGSGSAAAAGALAVGNPTGEYQYLLKQPAGTITASAAVKDGVVEEVCIEGDVSYDEILAVTVDY